MTSLTTFSQARRLGTALVFGSLFHPALSSMAREPVERPACLYSGQSALIPGEMICIRTDSFNHDLCSAIEHFAAAHRLPADYFARLIWRESRFRADAISSKGARGIAQFMPATAELRGLADSFDVLQALRASAGYLDELRTRFGNLGLAAAAYNAGEQRLSGFLASGVLPSETRSYVFSITGHTVDEWKAASADFALPPLERDRPFLAACVSLAEKKRTVPPYQVEGVWAPWGVQLAAGANSDLARSLFERAVSKLPSPLNSEQPLIVRHRDRSFGFRPRYAARIGKQTRREAEETCSAIQRGGGTCLVFKN